MKTKIKVFLLGVGSLRNYGCEGIVQGTYAMFREFWPECELIVATNDPDTDRQTFKGSENLRFVSDRKRFTLYRLWKGVLRRFFKIGKGSPARMNIELVKGNQIFLSCGGDNYCQMPDGSILHILEDLMQAGKVAKKNAIFYALWGASVGPFNKENESIIKESLQSMDAIFVREKLAYDYVASLGLTEEKNKLVADPAFYMIPDNSFVIEKMPSDVIIGLNISPLAFPEKIYPVFDSLLSLQDNIKLVCIPHVMSSNGGAQDDFTFLSKFIQQSKYKNRVLLLPSDLGARKTKGVISQCDLLIASRMHACVAGVSVGTPTLFLTYSNKGIGMSEYVYGHKQWMLSNTTISEYLLLDKVSTMLKEKKAIKTYLQNNIVRFKSDASKAIIELKKNYLTSSDGN